MTTREGRQRGTTERHRATRRVATATLAAVTLLLGGCMLLFLNEIPVAQFEAVPLDGAVPLTVTFDGRTSYDPDGQLRAGRWSFGDGESAQGFLVSHTYTAPGRYVVTFEVEDDEGACAAAQCEIVARGATNHAILIGIADYWRMTPLALADDDAIAMAVRLAGAPGWGVERTTLLINSDATTVNFRSALAGLETAGPDDTLLLFYSGHGSRRADVFPYDEADGHDETLCFFDLDLVDDELAALLAALPLRRLVVFIDACFSGGQLDSQSLPSGLAGTGILEDLERATAFGPKDLDRLDKEIVAIAASRRDQPSWEFGSLGHGAFTYALLEALGGSADLEGNRDGLISAEECYRAIAPRVAAFVAAQGGAQNPEMLDRCPGELDFIAAP